MIFKKIIIAVMRKQLTEEEMVEVEAKIADLQSEIEEDKMRDDNVDDDFELMIQTALTVSLKSVTFFLDLSTIFFIYGSLKNSGLTFVTF